MKYALVLWPLSNQRYVESHIQPAVSELEIILKAAGVHASVEHVLIAGAGALTFTSEELSVRQLDYIGKHSLCFLFGAWDGASLTPIALPGKDFVGSDLAAILKYKGKTNERFTKQLINLALYSCRFNEADEKIHLLDPMCGRGTTLFQAVNREWNATGIDADKKDILEGVSFFEKYLKFNKIKHKRSQSSRTIQGKAPVNVHSIRFGGEKGDQLSLNCAIADSVSTAKIFGKEVFSIICADLPYGVQHAPNGQGGAKSFENMLVSCLPAWREALKKGGAIALSYNTHTLKTERVREIMEKAGFEVMRGGAYDKMEHWVEQAVMRDIAVCVKN
ncbi:MAG: hypothetical protein E7322_01650 [Clostridiales bacterium]|nr:hypothetical protein [Clostridiales bacterium]